MLTSNNPTRWHYYYFHFTDEETESEWNDQLPEQVQKNPGLKLGQILQNHNA